MTLKTGMLVGIVGTEDIGVLIQIRSASNSCVIKLNNGTLKKNVPLGDVEEAQDMSDTKDKKSPIRLGGVESPTKPPSKLASLAVDTRTTNKLKHVLDVGDSVRARCNGGSRWFPGKIIRVHRDNTYDVEYSDGDIEKKMAAEDVEAVSKVEKTPLGASSSRKQRDSLSFAVGDKVKARYKKGSKLFSGKIARVRSDGTYDITYDDGDSETRVAKELIEPVSDVRKQDSEEEAPTRTKSSGFQVDQSVKARYKGGKKVFPGKIKRVHSDGTYDLLYDDGDEEKRVKEENIKASGGKSESEEDRKPAKGIKKLSVGKNVKARYKKGKRLFPGKISRVRSDGTYDIDYDDGEMETRVDASQIEVSDDEDMFADSDGDKKGTPATKKKAAKWVVGDRVRVYYGKGNKLFPGKIAKVHMNGTYDIKYDDGDSEVRVEATFIQGGESDTSDQDKLRSSKSEDNSNAKSSTKSSLRVGDAVKAKYKRGARFFSGKITRERMDGTYDIKYEDGDTEERVEVDFIQHVDDTDEREDGDKPKKKSKKSFEVGDTVKAPFQKGSKLFRGKISRVRSDGTYDITFDDGDKDTHVPSDLIQPEEGQTIRDEKTNKVVLKVGDAVKARYKKGKKLFAGTVTRARSDGTFDIKYDDGDVEMRVELEMIEVPESNKSKEDDKPGSQKAPKRLKVGDKVRARYNKGSKMFSGEITAVHRDGTFDVRYEDGDKEKNVEAKDIELEEDEREAQQPKSPDKLKVGDLVEAKYKNGVKMFPGKISRVHSDGTYDITFHDGDSDRRVPRSRIKPQEENQKSSPKKKTGFAVGDAVKAKYKKGAKYFSGKIIRVRSDGTYDIEYDDGDSETRVDVSLIVSAEPEMAQPSADSLIPSKPKPFEVGDAIKARYKKGTKLFPGKIIRVRSDGTYDIRYDDGDTEMYVESSYIEGEEKPKARDKADEKKPEGLAVGDRINAKYKGGMKMYPGKIVKVRMDGTFDIEYDDGDMELRVKSSSIELIPGSKVKKPEAKANTDKDDIFGDSDSDSKSKKRDDKKFGSIKVGDVVEANFKQKGKFHRGKVARSRSDGTFDIEYDVGASEKNVRVQDIKKVGSNQGKSDDSGDEGKGSKKNFKSKPAAVSSGSDKELSKTNLKKSTTKKSKSRSSSESSESDREKQPVENGTRVTYRKADDKKARRVGVVRKVHSDGSCDVRYEDGDTSKRISRKLLVVCSDSENSDDDSAGKPKQRRPGQGQIYRRHERVMCNWHRSSKLSKPKMTEKWTKAVVLERNSDGTYSIRYKDGVVEEDVPPEALKFMKDDSDSDESSSGQRRKRKLKRDRMTHRTDGIGTESLFLLEQLAMTLFEEGALTKKPKLQLLKGGDDTSSSDSSASSSTESASASSKSSRKTNNVDKVLKRLFDSSSLHTYRRMFKENDTKGSGKISQSRIIALVEDFMAASKPAKGSGRANQKSTQSDDDGSCVKHILSEWFATHDDLRIHRRFEFKTLMLAFAYAKSRLGKLRIQQSVAIVLEGRFASYHESKRQLEIWQQKLGYRLFETLQRHFHDHALPNMIPSRIRVSEVALILEQIAKQAMPNKPLDVYFHQHHLFPHQTLVLPEFLCCYYQLYGSEHSTSRWTGAVELRPVAFVASCLFSNGDIVCKRHGDLVRRLSVGRTQAQLDLILRFREAFESLLSTDTDTCNPNEEQLLETSQLSAFAAKVAPDPSLLEPAMTSLRKRSAAVSLVEVFGSCGFIIDELTSAPTIRNALEKMRMRVDLAEVRRIIGLVRNICVKILRFPNNADYWRIRADSAAFQQKIGRFDGATSLLEAVGFVEYQKTHYELRGARNADGKRISALEKSTLDVLREKCIQLDGELSLFDGVESISSILERISKVQEREGCHFTLEECQTALKNLSLYIENVLKNPKNSRCWCIREANSTFQRQIGYLPHATELMESIGFDLAESSNGNVYTLRGTGTAKVSGNKTQQDTQSSASLSNFSFTSVSSQMEWFLWRRKQEIDSLLEDEMKYLHEIVGNFSHAQNSTALLSKVGSGTQRLETSESREAAFVKMYPYGTNAIETFNKSSIQRRQLDMMKNTFSKMDVDQKGFLVEADFTRAYGSPSSLPAWSRFDAFDINKDGKVDIADFVAALGPMLDHYYELTTNKKGDVVAMSSSDDADPTMCEIVSLAVGNLRIGTSCSAAAVALESLLSQLYSIIQEPGNSPLWSISSTMMIGNKLLRFPAGHELLRIVGFRETTSSSNGNGSAVSTKTYELQQQRVRFKTSSSVSESPSSLDTNTLGRIQTIASMLAGHYRGLVNPCVSDVSAVSRAISSLDRCSENWSRAVEIGVKCLTNIEADPTNPRYRELNTATNTFTKIVGSVQGGFELLLSIGFRETDSGTLRIPSDSSLEELRARHLELEVGLSLLRLRLANNEHLHFSVPSQVDQHARNQLVEKRSGHATNQPSSRTNSQQETKRKAMQAAKNQPQPQHFNRVIRDRPATAAAQRLKHTKSLSKTSASQSARHITDPIENEILSSFPPDEGTNSRVNRITTLKNGKSTSNTSSRKSVTMGHNRALTNRKQAQRRSPSTPPSAGGHTMVLAKHADAGTDTILVQKSQFVRRGAFVRVGAEIRDLYEERMVVEVFTNDHTPGVTMLRLGVPLRFFHAAKELVSTILVPTTELSKRLEISDNQTLVREVVRGIIDNVADQEMFQSPGGCELEREVTPNISKLQSTLVTSFEIMNTVPIGSSNIRVGPAMRYIATWGESSVTDETPKTVNIFKDDLSEGKLQAYWEGFVLQSGNSSKSIRLGDLRQVVRRNAYLSMLLSTATTTMGQEKVFASKSNDFQLAYDGFLAFFRLPPFSKRSGQTNRDEGDGEAQLQLPLAYFRKHFQILSQTTSSHTNGFKSVQALQLLRKVYKDVQDHPPVACEDPLANQAGLEIIQKTCLRLEKGFVGNLRTGCISWPELVYFVRYNKFITIPEGFPSTELQLKLRSEDVHVPWSPCKEVAEVVSGKYSSRLVIIYFDGCVEVWNTAGNTPLQESMGFVLFSTKKLTTKSPSSCAERDVDNGHQEVKSKTFMEAWMDANQTGDLTSASYAEQVKLSSARIHQFKRSTGAFGRLISLCAWDSILCVNSSVLQEPSSGSFRFFRLATNFVSPIQQVSVDHVKADLSILRGKTACKVRSRESGKKGFTASSSGVIRTFEVTTDGSKLVFLTASDTIIWVACAGTGATLCHVNLLASQVGRFRAFFQLIDNFLPSDESPTVLYATTSAKSYRHVGMWMLPQETNLTKTFDRKKVFSFGKANAATVTHLAVNTKLLFVACRDGSIIVWDTTTDQTPPILPLVCLKISLRDEDLHSIICRSLDQHTIGFGTNLIQVGDRTAADIDQWDAEVLQRLDTPPLRYALYLFDDAEVVRLPVSKRFDVRLVTLDDPGFEFEVFLAPVSGVEHNQARRVALHKHRITRILFIALHHHRAGIFAHKSIQEFFQDFERHNIIWKTREEMQKFALSYQENVVVELRPFYRRGDNENTELTQPKCLNQTTPNGGATEKPFPVFAVGAILKSRAGQAQLQTWKFAINWLTNDARNELQGEPGNVDHAKRTLALQSSYQFEARRLLRIHNDYFREKLASVMKSKRALLVQNLKDGLRDIIANIGQPNAAADNLLKAVDVLKLASFNSQMDVNPLENFTNYVFYQADDKEIVHQESGKAGAKLSRLVELLRRDERNSVAFGAWIKRIQQTILAENMNQEKFIAWDWVNTLVRHLSVRTFKTAEVGALFVDLGLADAFTTSGKSNNDTVEAFLSSSSLPSFVSRLHRFLCSKADRNEESKTLEATMDALLPSSAVVELIVECTNFSAFFGAKLTDFGSYLTKLSDTDQLAPEETYAIRLRIQEWKQKLRHLAQAQNELYCEFSDHESENELEPTVEDLQQLQRFLRTPLPCVSPKLSSITLESRCGTIVCHDRFIMKAIGRREGGGVEFISLSVLYIFINGEEMEQNFQQERAFLRKVQHLRVREYFLPAYIETMNVPILPAANASLAYSEDRDGIHCIVTESLDGWSSLSECVKLMRLSPFDMVHWKPLLWFWSLRVLMALLTMQNEHFTVKQGIDLSMLLVSPDGCDLRMCSLAGGAFVRYGDNNEDADSLCRSMAKVFGVFVYELLLRTFSDVEDVDSSLENLRATADNSEEVLCNTRNQVIRLLTSIKTSDKNYDSSSSHKAALTDFSSASQIAALGNEFQKGGEVERLCHLALLALQPLSSRLGLQTLWVYAGKPRMDITSESDVQLNRLSMQMMDFVGLQRSLRTLQRDIRTCVEECEEEVCVGNSLHRVVEGWLILLNLLVQHETSTIKSHVLQQVLEVKLPHQICVLVMRSFTRTSKNGEREQGRQAVEILLESFSKVLELVEAKSSFEKLAADPLLIRLVLQVLSCLLSIATAQMPQNQIVDQWWTGTTNVLRFHRDTTSNAVLWRLSDPFFRELLAIEMSSSRYPTLLRWLNSRRPPFGFTRILPVGYEVETCSSGVEVIPKQEVRLWWSDHATLIPQHLPSSGAEDELVNKDTSAGEPMIADYLQCVYETKEIEFKLVSGVSVPKFRLAALQQFFGPTFFERKYCYPLVLVQPLVATVWKDLRFERLICTLLRDGDEKMTLGALSLLECGTRVFRFDALRSPRFGAKETTPNAQHSLTFSCPERNFSMQLCSQNVVMEVKRVLERTIRSLKVLGESGTSSASRSQHPLIAILCVGMAWLVNCLHGGDQATPFWGVAGINQLIVTHCKANSLPFVKMKDLNMMNQVFHQGQRIAQQDSVAASKWQVFSSTIADSSNHRLSSLNCSPFRLMIEEIVVIGSSRAVGLIRTLLLPRTFREVAAITDDSAIPSDSAFQRDLISSSDYGKVSHAIDLARDISQLNGTTNEQLQLVQYTKALFLHYTATSAKLRCSVFAPVCSEIWSWMGAAWRTVVVHCSKSKQNSSGNKAVKLSKAQGDIVIAGFDLLHSTITHPSVQIEDIVELTTFDARVDDQMANILHEIFAWIMNSPSCSAIRRGSTLDVLKTNGVDLLTSFVRARKFDEVALETVTKCVDTQLLLQLLGTDCTCDASGSNTIISIGEKQKIWSVLLYFDSRNITSSILETEFLDIVVISRLSRPDTEARSPEDEVDNCNRRLEAVMMLEALVFAASRRKSVNTQVLFAEVCKLLLHHDIIAKEAKYLRKSGGSSRFFTKHVAVSKRVMQLVCCLCVDFSSQSASRVFLEHLESVGIPAWVVDFHQAKPNSEHQLSTRVELFWKDWRGDANTKPVGRTLALQSRNKSKSENRIAQIPPRVHTRQKTEALIKVGGSDDELGEGSLDKPLVSVSPVKPIDVTSKPNLVKLKAAGIRSKTAAGKKNANVIQTLLSIDADSALRLVKSSPQEAMEDDQVLNSDAYSPFSVSSSSSEQCRHRLQSKFKRQEEKPRRDRDAKDETKRERDTTDNLGSDSSDSPTSSSVSSRDGPRQKIHARKSIRQRCKPAAPPQKQPQDTLQAIFRKYDVDGDGSISFIDLRRAMDKQLAGHRLSDLEIQRWITEKDRSGQGVVGFKDFVAAFQSRVLS